MNKKYIKIRILLFFISILSLSGYVKIHAGQKEKSAQSNDLSFTNVDSNKIILFRGKKKRLILPNTIKGKILWKSSRPKVASVSNKGRVYAKRIGKAKITAKFLKSKKKISVYITVKKYIAPKKIRLTAHDSRVILEGDTLLMTAAISPKNASKNTIIWSSSRPNVASVSGNGLVTGHTPGNTKITAQIKGTSIRRSKNVNVKKRIIKVDSLTFLHPSMTILYEETAALPFWLLPEHATNPSLRFYSSSPNIVSVDNFGQVTGLRPGTSRITAKTCDGTKLTAAIDITVKAEGGLLKKKDLDALNLDGYNNLMIVAHPDDEAIFAGSQLIDDDYLVVCLTSGYNLARKNEFMSVVNQTKDRGLVLSYPDLTFYAPKHLKRDDWNTVKYGLLKDIQLLLQYKDWEKIVTHNPKGEYGHQHHIMTSQYVTEQYKAYTPSLSNLYYFGYYSANYIKENAEYLPTISEENLVKKRQVLQLYTTQQTMVKRLSYMGPYEFLIPAEEWKTGP